MNDNRGINNRDYRKERLSQLIAMNDYFTMIVPSLVFWYNSFAMIVPSLVLRDMFFHHVSELKFYFTIQSNKQTELQKRTCANSSHYAQHYKDIRNQRIDR